jgi:hypothetical protein
MNPTCYEAPVLADYLAGRAAANLARQVESHLRTCRRCQQALVRSSPPADSLLEAVRATRSVDRAESEPELALALGAIRHLHTGSTPGGSSEQSSADTGRLISNYELQKKLGEGGMGAVYLARHLRLKKSVAIKLLKGERSQDDSAIARFQVEIEAVGKLEHPHIVRALDAGEDRGTHFLVMEYLAGIDVARLVRGLGPMGLPEACELVRQAALGLHHAHENDVIHRDVKPSNLMLLAGGKVKVLDLGLAHFRPDWGQSQGLTRADQVLGTLLYVAPEQLAPGGKVDARTDVYSLGVTLAEILLGRVPCRSGYSVLLGDEERAARPDVPPDIWQLIARMTALEPQGRPGSMLTVAETLRPWCAAANLGRLLERLAGQTTFADPTIAAAGFAAPTSGTSPNRTADDPGFGESVAPPPIVGVMEMRGGLPGDVSIPNIVSRTEVSPERETQRFGQRLDSWAGKLVWLVSGSVLALLVALAIWGLSQYPAEPVLPPGAVAEPDAAQSTAVTTGTALIECTDPVYADLVKAILDESALLAVPEEGGQPITLRKESITLPAGQYKLQRAPGHWPVGQQDWEIDQAFVVEADSTVKIMPLIQFPTPWKFPRIPAPGHRVIYTGSLTLRQPSFSLPAVGSVPVDELAVDKPAVEEAAAEEPFPSVAAQDAARPMHFDLAISTLDDEAVGGEPHRWLKLELTDKGGDYRETAYLLVDTNEYEQHHRLMIERGWIAATSTQIVAALARELPDAPPTAIAAEFDAAVDRLVEPARRIHLTLPSDRIGIHTALVLLFDADCQSAPAAMRTIRASLPEPTSYTLATVNPGSGLRTGMVIEAEQLQASPVPDQQPLKTLLQVKRSETVPFSFVSLHLDSPLLSAELKIASHTDLTQPLAIAPMPLDRLTLTNQRISELPLEADPLDVAALPADGEGVRYLGAIKFPKSSKFSAPFFGEVQSQMPSFGELNYSAQVRMLRSEEIDRQNYRWLEVDVTTKQAGNSHRERAVILIDEARFQRHGELAIVRGWFETGEHWLPLTTDMPRPMETIAADLELLGAPLPPVRLGVHDVLALLTKTSLQSMFGDVREEFANWRTLHEESPQRTLNEKFRFGTADRTVVADVWTLGKANQNPNYRIVRSREIPFQIVNVRITTRLGVTLTAEVGDVIAADAAELADLALPDAATWEFHKEAHETKVELARRKQNAAAAPKAGPPLRPIRPRR